MVIKLIGLFLNLMRTKLTIKTHVAKLKMIKDQRQNISMKMIQKTQKQKNFCNSKLFATNINSLKPKQREVFNVVQTWAKDYVKYDGHHVETVHVFISGSRETSKSYFVKVIYENISKAFFIIARTLRNQEFFYLDLQEYQQ